MAKTYTDRLGEWVQHRNSTRRDRNVVAFLTVRDDVASALDAGHAAKTVWTNLREAGRTEIGYDTFLNYIHRFIRQPDKPRPVPRQEARSKPKPAPAPDSPAPTPRPPANAGFTFNAAPRKEDLL